MGPEEYYFNNGEFSGDFLWFPKNFPSINKLPHKPGRRFLFLSFLHGLLNISSMTATGGKPLTLAGLKRHSRKMIRSLYKKLERVSSI